MALTLPTVFTALAPLGASASSWKTELALVPVVGQGANTAATLGRGRQNNATAHVGLLAPCLLAKLPLLALPRHGVWGHHLPVAAAVPVSPSWKVSAPAELGGWMWVSLNPLCSPQGCVLKYLEAFQQGERGSLPFALSPRGLDGDQLGLGH